MCVDMNMGKEAPERHGGGSGARCRRGPFHARAAPLPALFFIGGVSGLQVYSLGCRVWGLGFGVQGLGFRL